MSTETLRRCDQCQAIMPDGRNRYVLDASLLVMPNGIPHDTKHITEADLCSPACVVSAVAGLVKNGGTP